MKWNEVANGEFLWIKYRTKFFFVVVTIYYSLSYLGCESIGIMAAASS